MIRIYSTYAYCMYTGLFIKDIFMSDIELLIQVDDPFQKEIRNGILSR